MSKGIVFSDRSDARRRMDALPFYQPALIAKKPKDSAYPTELKTVGDHIRARRLELGLYRKDIAQRLGVTTNTITNWEKERSSPNLRVWPAVIQFLGYDPRPDGQTIGERFRLRRQALGLSWAEAARIMGVDPSTLSKWELGKEVPQGSHFDVVKHFLGEYPDSMNPDCSESAALQVIPPE